MNKYHFTQFAQAYGDHAYGNCSYNQNTGVCSTQGSSTTNPSGGGLVNTGFMVAAIVTLACLAIFVAILVRVWRRPKTLQDAEPVEVVEEDATRQAR